MPYAQLSDVEGRIEEPLDDDQKRIALTALEDLSAEARFYGANWPDDRCPEMVKVIVLRAIMRWLPNALGLIQSRAGDETLVFTDRGLDAGAPTLTEAEKRMLQKIADPNSGGIVSVPIAAWSSGERRPYGRGAIGYVPSGANSEPFPMFASDVDPW